MQVEILKMRLIILAICLFAGHCSARWLRRGRADLPKETSFVGEATNELSNVIFQGYIDDGKNIAFSPLGYSAILAILAEGAEGETRQQLATALHLPADSGLTRNTYKFIMERLKNTNEYKYNQPELKNYFYIYKNYTINDDYKKILEDYYLTDVRSVERYTPDDFNDDDDKDAIKVKADETVPNKEADTNKSDEKLITFAVEDKPEKVDVTSIEYKPAKNIKEKIKLVKTYPKKVEVDEEEETMLAVEARNHARSLQILSDKNDVSSSISVNSVGKKSNKAASHSLMIMFNGMYFRGAWKKPFDKVEPCLFYKSSSEKKLVPTMKTRGTFKTGSVPGLDSEAIELPYDGGRYALLLVLPRARDGLTRLIADLPAASLADIQDNLLEETLDVSLPTFYIETTTKPVAALAKFGVSSIFGRDADLSRVSPTEGLFVQELVQHVAVRVDNANSVASQLTAGNTVQELKNLPLSKEEPAKKFSADRPFLFYIVDRLDNLIVVAGKVTDPKQPESFDVK